MDKLEQLQAEKAQTCVSYHIQAFQRQAMQGEMADITEACKHCLYNQECDFAWSAYISSAIPLAKYRFTLAEGLAYQQQDITL